MIQLPRIREKLDAIRQRDTAYLVHGAEVHHYRLEPVLSQAEADVFEQEFGVHLPEEYIAFLMEIGNGGAGPGYGVFSLGKSVKRFRQQQKWAEERSWPVPQLDRPFPLTAAVAAALIACQRTGRVPRIANPHIAVQFRLDGIMDICHHGCEAYEGLVLSGEQRCCIWSSSGLRWGHGGPDSGGFLVWYEEWLDGWLRPGAIERWAKTIGHE